MRVAQIEVIIADFDRTVTALEEAIQTEQSKTGIQDPAHVAYSTSAKAMILRRDNLSRSVDRLKRQLVDLKIALE
jgi:flagellar FliJ protein